MKLLYFLAAIAYAQNLRMSEQWISPTMTSSYSLRGTPTFTAIPSSKKMTMAIALVQTTSNSLYVSKVLLVITLVAIGLSNMLKKKKIIRMRKIYAKVSGSESPKSPTAGY